MLTNAEFISTIKIYVNEYLGSQIIQIKHLDDLESFSCNIENAVGHIIKSVICMYPESLIVDHIAVCDDCSLIDDMGTIYKINISPEVTDFTVLNIAIINSRASKQNVSQTYKFSNAGKYNSIHFILTKSLRFNIDILRQAVTQILDTCYTFYKIKLREYITSDLANVSKNVYNYIFGIICDDELNNDFWLAIVGNGVGFRLVNPSIVERLFTTFAKHKHNDDDVSINELIANLLDTKLPYEKILMKAAVDYNQCITVDLTNAVYTKEGSLYSKTMYTLYGGESFSIFPVYIGDISIVALYPVEKREAIEMILNTYKPKISEIIEHEMQNIEKAFTLFSDFDIESSRIGLSTSLFSYSTDNMLSVLKKFLVTDRNGIPQFISSSSLSPDERVIHLWLVDKGFLEEFNGLYRITNFGLKLINGDSGIQSQDTQQLERLLLQIDSLIHEIIIELPRLQDDAPIQYSIFDLKIAELLKFKSTINGILNGTFSESYNIEEYINKINEINTEWTNRNRRN